MSTHKCPAPDCQQQVPFSQLACRGHWYAIPKPLRDAVWSAYDNGNGMGTPEHTHAVVEAVKFLQDK